jgi:hypothetical protein
LEDLMTREKIAVANSNRSMIISSVGWGILRCVGAGTQLVLDVPAQQDLPISPSSDALAGAVVTLVGLPGLKPLPWWQTLAIFVCAIVACLGLNDAVKVAMIKWRVPDALAKRPV